MADLKLGDVLPLLANKRQTSNGYTSRCPSHNDQHNSLSISEGANETLLLKCHAGCSFKSIITALNIPVKSKGNGYKPQRVIKEIYDYTDENGELLFQSLRFEPKNFRQRRPDGKNGWIWNLQQIRLVLYKLPEVLASPLVYIVEGEKDVETLRANDLPATCNPMGAGKWRDEYSESLRDKTVVILPDNDKPGREHAEKIANALYGIATEIIIVNLPNLSEKGDVTDYFQNGGTEKELIDLANKAESWQPLNARTQISEGINNTNLFMVKTANTWIDEAKQRPIPKMLCGEFWFEGELCILFSDTNLGKSILAVQIGESIATGKEIGILQMTAKPQKVLYCDFELSDKQFEARYSIQHGEFFDNHHRFAENFLRAEINPEASIPYGFQNFEEFLSFSLEAQIAETEATILILDNLTYLRNETEKAKDALPMMKHLKAIKQRFGLSILALAHTPKRDPTKPLGKNDLQGSRHLLNFCDSAFAIGESHKDKSFRYLKQIKERNTGKIYDAENVLLFQIEKPENFLQFNYEGFARENEHLKILSDSDRENLITKAKELSLQGRSQREIASTLGISLGVVNKYVRS